VFSVPQWLKRFQGFRVQGFKGSKVQGFNLFEMFEGFDVVVLVDILSVSLCSQCLSGKKVSGFQG
jgi:hypothetical protein